MSEAIRKQYCVGGVWKDSKTEKWMPVTDSSTGEVIAEVPSCTQDEVLEAIDAADKADFDNAISYFRDKALYDTGVTAAYGDKLITLSTCEYSRNNSRLVVVAKRITEGGDADAAQTHAEAAAAVGAEGGRSAGGRLVDQTARRTPRSEPGRREVPGGGAEGIDHHNDDGRHHEDGHPSHIGNGEQ